MSEEMKALATKILDALQETTKIEVPLHFRRSTTLFVVNLITWGTRVIPIP